MQMLKYNCQASLVAQSGRTWAWNVRVAGSNPARGMLLKSHINWARCAKILYIMSRLTRSVGICYIMSQLGMMCEIILYHAWVGVIRQKMLYHAQMGMMS